MIYRYYKLKCSYAYYYMYAYDTHFHCVISVKSLVEVIAHF